MCSKIEFSEQVRSPRINPERFVARSRPIRSKWAEMLKWNGLRSSCGCRFSACTSFVLPLLVP